MFTIEDLREGKCAVINDGALYELREVLELAFPVDTTEIRGNYLYYLMKKNNTDEWYPVEDTYLPTQSVKDFLSKKLKRGDLVWVSDSNPEERIVKLIFLTEIEGSKAPFVCVWRSDTDSFRSGEPFNIVPYKYATKVEEPKEVEMTIEEIEKALNIKLKIVK